MRSCFSPDRFDCGTDRDSFDIAGEEEGQYWCYKTCNTFAAINKRKQYCLPLQSCNIKNIVTVSGRMYRRPLQSAVRNILSVSASKATLGKVMLALASKHLLVIDSVASNDYLWINYCMSLATTALPA